VADVPAAGAPPAAPALPGPPPRASSAEPAAPALPQEIAGHRAPALSAQAPADPSGPPAPLARSAPDAAPAVPAGVRSGAELEALPAPEYPARSRRMGEEGVVLLMVEVLPDGRAGEVRVIKDPGYPRLAEAAEAAARTARFRPATLDGKPVRSWVEIPVRFALR
jgi:protein TonB